MTAGPILVARSAEVGAETPANSRCGGDIIIIFIIIFIIIILILIIIIITIIMRPDVANECGQSTRRESGFGRLCLEQTLAFTGGGLTRSTGSSPDMWRQRYLLGGLLGLRIGCRHAPARNTDQTAKSQYGRDTVL